MNRRTFIATSAGALLSSQLFSDQQTLRRVAIIGHTGRGNYGHGLDKVWTMIPGAEIVGVSDPDEEGLAKALARLGTSNGFSDYRKMLKETRPEFVSVSPRHADQHFDMTMAAIESGAKGIYVEKPFCRTPAEADELIAAAEKHGAKIAVAHRNRYNPVLPVIDQLIADGEIGRLLEIQGHGKGDRRGGAEDLWVLGGHVLNLFQYFGGDPVTCSAIILQDGKLATRKDVVEGAEGLGLMAGNEIHATYHLANGLVATYKTFTDDGSNNKGYALHLLGTNGTITIEIDGDPLAWLTPGNAADPTSRSNDRIPITTAGLGKEETQPEKIKQIYNHVIPVLDLIAAVDNKRPPLCDAHQGALAVEMICAAFESHRQNGARVRFPLKERGNPWKNF
jgi:predicted dehydrogenase